MWKKEDSKFPGVPDVSTASIPSSSTPVSNAHPAATVALPVSSKAAACISQGIRIRGEVTGSEDLFVDGQVEGKLNLANGSLTVGPNGNVKADVNAREVIVRGRLEGKVTGREKIQLWSTGQVTGDVQTERLAIEDGAMLRGNVEAGKPSKAVEARAAAAAATGKSTDSSSIKSGTATV